MNGHELRFRAGIWDRGIWDSVAVHNEYRLAVAFDPRDVVLDIGAHIGSFAYAVLERGAGRVVAVEAEPENARYLSHNLHRACGATDRCLIVTAAAWRSDLPDPLPVVRFRSVGENTGGGTVLDGFGFPVAAVAFDRLVQLAVGDGPLRLLKLDCEGAEWPILFTSRRLAQVRAIVGEYHVRAFPDFGVCGPEEMRRFLSDNGFEVVAETVHAELGHFWAWRAGYAVTAD